MSQINVMNSISGGDIASLEEEFDYAKAVAELEEIAKKVENPETKLDDVDLLVGRSKELVKACRDYLRGVKEKIDALDRD